MLLGFQYVSSSINRNWYSVRTCLRIENRSATITSAGPIQLCFTVQIFNHSMQHMSMHGRGLLTHSMLLNPVGLVYCLVTFNRLLFWLCLT